MRKVVIHRAGSYDRLQLEEPPDPEPRAGEVLIDVEACGVNYADCVVRMGLYASAKEYVGWPITPGFEFAGSVVSSGGTELAPGTRVFGVTRFGGYASKICVPAGQVFPLPDGWSATEAAAMPAVFLTAWYALHDLAAARAGASVLVHSAAGGVGGTLCQLGRIADCRVVGVVGASDKVDVARRLGAEAVIDKSPGDPWDEIRARSPRGDGLYDVVLDANGTRSLRESYRSLAPQGRLVAYGFHTMLPRTGGKPNPLKLALAWLRTPRFDPLDMSMHNKSVMAFNLSFLFHRHDLLADAMGAFTRLAEEGSFVKPPIETYALDRVADAHRALESGRTVGKLVLLP